MKTGNEALDRARVQEFSSEADVRSPLAFPVDRYDLMNSVLQARSVVDTVRYEAVNAMLPNEFLKEHKKMEEQQRQLTEQGKEIT